MASRYNIGDDLVGSDKLTSMSPHWALGFARFAVPVTYDTVNRRSFSTDPAIAYRERSRLIVTDDCFNLSISASKSSHTISLQANLYDSGTKYLNEILPGDWVVCNILYDSDAAEDVVNRMRNGKSVNGWNDGFKFLGRVNTVHKQVSVKPDGKVTSSYALNAIGFSELDTTVMYYPQLAHRDVEPVSLEQFGITVNDIVRGKLAQERGAIDINRVIPTVFEAIFGKGAWSKAAKSPVTGAPSPNRAYIVPQTVMLWMNRSGGGTFADLVPILMGVQKFSKVADASSSSAANPWDLFQPDGFDYRDGSFRTPAGLIGSFPISAIPQGFTTAWSFMSNYLNLPLNEVLLTLRPHKDGHVYPTLTVRQNPFTTEIGAYNAAAGDLNIFRVGTVDDNPADTQVAFGKVNLITSEPVITGPLKLTTTRFLEVPRWVIPVEITPTSDLGRSDALRFNLTYVYGTGPGVVMEEVSNFVRAPPVKDELDIMRNGVRPYMPSVNCFIRDLVEGPVSWRDLMADIVMGQHLTFSGSIVCAGIRAPIAPGDNAEFEGLVYHIESVAHRASISPEGFRSFFTTLTLSRGVADVKMTEEELRSTESIIPGVSQRERTFAGVRTTDAEKPEVGSTKYEGG